MLEDETIETYDAYAKEWHDDDFKKELTEAGFEIMRHVRTEKSQRTTWLKYFVRAV